MPSSTPPARDGSSSRRTPAKRTGAPKGTGRPVTRGKGAQKTPRVSSYQQDRKESSDRRDGNRSTSAEGYRGRPSSSGRPPSGERRTSGSRAGGSRDGYRDDRAPRPASSRRRDDDGERSSFAPRPPAGRRRDDSERTSYAPRPRSGRRRPDDNERSSSRDHYERTARGERGARPARDGGTRRPSSSGDRRGTTRTPPPLTPEELKRKRAGETARERGWGSVARRGAVNIESTGQELASPKSQSRNAPPVDTWELVERPTSPAAAPKEKPRVKYALPGDVAADVRKAFIGTANGRERIVATLTKAAEAYDRHRYEEALRLGRIVADATPGVAPVRELAGLAAYRAERWAAAKVHLRSYFTITGDPEHLPLVMDADRANHRYRAVEKTYEEVMDSEPTAEVIAEARIVYAATLADQRKFDESIELLTKAGAAKNLRNPSYRHVRLWYALADVYDRAGDTTSARELFARVVLAEPDAYDARERLKELGASAPAKNRKRRATPVSKKKVD